MNPFVQLLLTLVLVIGALFVDHALVSRDGAGIDASAPPSASASRSRAEEVPDEEQPTPLAILQGTGNDRWHAEVERRLSALETRAGPALGDRSAARAPDGSPEAPAAEGDEPAEDLVVPGAEDASPGSEGKRPVTKAELVRFRRMLETVEQQRQWEAEARKVSAFLDKIGVELSNDQRRQLIRTHLGFAARWRKLARTPANDDAARQDRRTAYESLFAEYERAVRDEIPAREADILLGAIRELANRASDGGRR